jgi:peroxiredoxin
MLELIAKDQAKTAPDFSGADASGINIKLSDFKGKSNVVLVLNRGFQCPYTRKHMMLLRQDYLDFKDQQTEILVIGPEDEKAFQEYWETEKMPLPGLADPQHIIAKKYGQEVKILKMGRMPAFFVIDREGLIRFQHHGQSMSDIPENEDVIDLLKKLNSEKGSATAG